MFVRFCILTGGIIGALAVAMAAVAAHGLGELAPSSLDAVRSAIQMQGWHAVALVAVAAWLPRGGIAARIAALGFVAGTLLFGAAVYGHELADLPVAALAPVGGTTLIVSWVILAGSAFRPGA